MLTYDYFCFSSDCLDNLVCFQRDALEPVPGCIGAGLAAYDYCIMVENATTLNADADDSMVSPMEEENAMPLGLCEGDCDVDADCLDELVCFQREADEEIPGCADGITGTDYCVKPTEESGDTVFVTAAPTEATSMNVTGVSLFPLVSIAGDADSPMGLCQGVRSAFEIRKVIGYSLLATAHICFLIVSAGLRH